MLCPRCSSPVGARARTPSSRVATCACGELVRLVALPRPRAVEVHGDAPMVVSLRWYGPGAWFVLTLALAWIVTLAFMVAVLTLAGLPLLALALSVPLVLVGGGLAYLAIAAFVNRTEIAVDAQAIRVRHAPLWIPHAVELERARTRRVFAEERTFRHEEGTSRWAALCADVDGTTKDLLMRVSDREVATYLAQLLSARLGLDGEGEDR